MNGGAWWRYELTREAAVSLRFGDTSGLSFCAFRFEEVGQPWRGVDSFFTHYCSLG